MYLLNVPEIKFGSFFFANFSVKLNWPDAASQFKAANQFLYERKYSEGYSDMPLKPKRWPQSASETNLNKISHLLDFFST